jgi:two-component system, OmpR family, copper resistance phosphate regulon response regulator CusR
VLDLMLPGKDGLTVLRDLRGSGFTRPILVVTARDAVDDRVVGLDSGADDYLVKPFAFSELLARLRAMLRRDRPAPEIRLRCGDLELDMVTRRVTRGEHTLDLTTRQYELLRYLMQHGGEIVTRDMLAHHVWKDDSGIMTNVIEVYINQLRRKLERPELPSLLHTVRGAGYVLRSAPTCD